MTRPALHLAVIVLLATASVARATDLSGTWESEDGPVTIAGRGSDTRITGAVTGRGTFDGARLSVTIQTSPGLARGLLPNASSGTQTARTYTFTRRDRYDWLTAPGVHPLFKSRHHDGGLNGPWWSKSDDVKITDGMINGLFADLMDIAGDDDHIVDARDPSPDLTVPEKWAVLVRFQRMNEKRWGMPVTTLGPTDFASGAIHDFFCAQKTVALVRYHRTPAEVRDRFITIDGSIEGNAIKQRKLLTQYWAPIGKDTGVVGAFSPGYENSGRIDIEQANLANAQGVGMFLLDSQWTYTAQGAHHMGGIDSGQGCARDSLGFASWVKATNPGKRMFLMGLSMGGGPGSLGMMTANETGAGWVAVDDGQGRIEGSSIVPKDTPLVCEAPYLKMTPNASNVFHQILGYIPLLRTHKFGPQGKPTTLPDERKRMTIDEEGVVQQPEAQNAASAFNAETIEKIDMGVFPKGSIYILQSNKDTTADYATNVKVVEALKRQGRPAELKTFDSDNHNIDEDPTQEKAFLVYLPAIVKLAR
jgi:hypothetical protein